MTKKAWAIKLGSGGRCVPFCERHQIIGIGWKDVDTEISKSASWSDFLRHMAEIGYRDPRQRGSATGQLSRFARDCEVGHYVLYYDPPRKHVVLTRVISDAFRRDFDLDDQTDIWQCRRVEYVGAPIPVVDFYGALKGRLLGPRMSFWELRDFDLVDQVANGVAPHVTAATDMALKESYRVLKALLVKRMEVLDFREWELLVADYFRAQGAQVTERVGGSHPRRTTGVECRVFPMDQRCCA